MQDNYSTFAKTAANYVKLSPVSFLIRAEPFHGKRPSVIYGDMRRDWAETVSRIRALSAPRSWHPEA